MTKKIPIYFWPIIIIIILALYFIYWKINNKDFTPVAPKSVSTFSEIKSANFSSAENKLNLNYPGDWKTKDLGGDKQIKEPNTPENVVFVYDPKNLKYQDDLASAQVSVKILRFVPEDSVKINSGDDWFNYIKAKVDSYIEGLGKVFNYSLISLSKTLVNDFFAVEEKYTQPETVQARDLYIYNQASNEFYQIITKAPKDLYDKFLPYFDLVVSSFKVEK